VGAVIRVLHARQGQHLALAQSPEAEGAFVALEARHGPRARARRGLTRAQPVQPRHAGVAATGLGFKPFVISAALEAGVTPTV